MSRQHRAQIQQKAKRELTSLSLGMLSQSELTCLPLPAIEQSLFLPWRQQVELAELLQGRAAGGNMRVRVRVRAHACGWVSVGVSVYACVCVCEHACVHACMRVACVAP